MKVQSDKRTNVKNLAVSPAMGNHKVGAGKSLLEELIRSMGDLPEFIPYRKLQEVADRLSQVRHAEGHRAARPWTWRYLRSVLNGTVDASQALVDAIMKLGALVDGAPVEAVVGERVQVLAVGKVAAGAMILGSSRRCANPACKVEFVPVVPWQKCHSRECATLVRALRQRTLSAISRQRSAQNKK